MQMKLVFALSGILGLAVVQGGEVRLYRTTGTDAFRERDCPLPSNQVGEGANVIDLDAATPRHPFLGLGVSFAEASAYLWAKMPEARRRDVMERLWTEKGAGLSIGRIHMGSSDYSMRFYSYDDTPDDEGLTHFSIDEDRRFVLPAIQAARTFNTNLFFFASPWSPPGWMKTNGTLFSGRVKPAAYPALANYFSRFLQTYAREGIRVAAVTVQNEPETDQGLNSPTCLWSAEDAKTFVVDFLAPTLARNGLSTQIWAYDHNFDAKGVAYVTHQLSDARFRAVTAAVAWHPYAGSPTNLAPVCAAFPDVPMYVTEMGPHLDRSQRDLLWWADLVFGSFNAGCGAFVSWCFLLDEEGQPNVSMGHPCAGLLEVDSRTGELFESSQFRLFRHIGPFVKRGARVLAAPLVEGRGRMGAADVRSVAFRNPDGSRVVVLACRAGRYHRRQVQVKADARYYPLQVLGGSVTTFVLPPSR